MARTIWEGYSTTGWRLDWEYALVITEHLHILGYKGTSCLHLKLVMNSCNYTGLQLRMTKKVAAFSFRTGSEYYYWYTTEATVIVNQFMSVFVDVLTLMGRVSTQFMVSFGLWTLASYKQWLLDILLPRCAVSFNYPSQPLSPGHTHPVSHSG